MISLAEAFEQAIKDAKKDGSWYKMINSPEFIEKMNKEYDVGCDCPGVDWDKFKALGVKLGFWEVEQPPTEEELKRREEFRNSPFGKSMSDMWQRANVNLAEMFARDIEFYNTSKWPIGTDLRSKLPNNYRINKIEEKK